MAWKKIEKAVDRVALEAAISRVEQLTPTAGSDLDELWRSELVKKYGSVRTFVQLLATVIKFQSTAEGAPILAALQRLPELIGRKKVMPRRWTRNSCAAPGGGSYCPRLRHQIGRRCLLRKQTRRHGGRRLRLLCPDRT